MNTLCAGSINNMDAVEELGNTYFYKGMFNLSAGELFFFIFLEEAQKQLGVNDVAVLALIILGQPTQKRGESQPTQPRGPLF